MLDTGSEVSLLPAVLVDKSYITRTSQTLKAANGTTIPILGEVAMPIRVGQFETTVNGLVSEHVSEVMLGIDWLTTNGAVWDFDKSQICIGGRSYRLFARTGDGHWCRRVSVQEDTVVPPRSEIDLMTRVICRPSKESATDMYWGTELTTVVPGVHVSRTLIPTDRLCDVPVRVVNVLTEPVLLTAGTTVADVQPVTIIGSVSADHTSMKR